MVSLQGKVGVITGAGSGIGLALARLLLARGMVLHLWELREEGLASAADALDDYADQLRLQSVDVSSEASVAVASEQLTQPIHLLVNNAGIAHQARFDQQTAGQFERVFQVNFNGVLNCTRALLPRLDTGGQIVNVASIGAYTAAPYFTSYCASKYAVRGFSEALREELRSQNINVLCVCPGGVRTGLAANSNQLLDQTAKPSDQPGTQSADQAASGILRAILRRRENVMIGWDAALLYVLERLVPAWLMRRVAAKLHAASADTRISGEKV